MTYINNKALFIVTGCMKSKDSETEVEEHSMKVMIFTLIAG